MSVPESEADQSLCGPRGSAQQPGSSCYYEARTAAGTLSRQTAGRTERPRAPGHAPLRTLRPRGSVPGATHTHSLQAAEKRHPPAPPWSLQPSGARERTPRGRRGTTGRGLAGVGGAAGARDALIGCRFDSSLGCCLPAGRPTVTTPQGKTPPRPAPAAVGRRLAGNPPPGPDPALPPPQPGSTPRRPPVWASRSRSLPGAPKPLCAVLRPGVSRGNGSPLKPTLAELTVACSYFLIALLGCNLQFRHLHSTGFTQIGQRSPQRPPSPSPNPLHFRRSALRYTACRQGARARRDPPLLSLRLRAEPQSTHPASALARSRGPAAPAGGS